MGMRAVDGPGKGYFVDTATAAAWLDISRKTLFRLAAASDWLEPTHEGRRVLWRWEDIHALAQVMAGKKRKNSHVAGEDWRGLEDAGEDKPENAT